MCYNTHGYRRFSLRISDRPNGSILIISSPSLPGNSIFGFFRKYFGWVSGNCVCMYDNPRVAEHSFNALTTEIFFGPGCFSPQDQHGPVTPEVRAPAPLPEENFQLHQRSHRRCKRDKRFQILLGESTSADAWTDGETYIAYNIDMESAMHEFNHEYRRERGRRGMTTNVDLAESADEWLPQAHPEK